MVDNQNYVNLEEVESIKMNEASEIVATMPKELIKSLFYVMTGKPDSMTKKFTGYVIIDTEALIDLNSQIRDKLNQYVINGITTTVNINYENHESKEFGSWQEFISHRWTGPEVTESIIMKWDFLAQLPEYPVPQRHTIMVRMSNGIGITEFMQAISSGDIEEMSKIESNMAPMFCRVDFINARMSSEIIYLVEKWHEALEKPIEKDSIIKKLKKHAKKIADLARYSVPIFITVLMFGIGEYISKLPSVSNYVTVEELKYMAYWMVTTGIIFYTFNKIGIRFAQKIYNALRKYGDFHVFSMTNGDRNEKKNMEQNNVSYKKSFALNIIGPLVINLVSAIITYKIFN